MEFKRYSRWNIIYLHIIQIYTYAIKFHIRFHLYLFPTYLLSWIYSFVIHHDWSSNKCAILKSAILNEKLSQKILMNYFHTVLATNCRIWLHFMLYHSANRMHVIFFYKHGLSLKHFIFLSLTGLSEIDFFFMKALKSRKFFEKFNRIFINHQFS